MHREVGSEAVPFGSAEDWEKRGQLVLMWAPLGSVNGAGDIPLNSHRNAGHDSQVWPVLSVLFSEAGTK